MRGGLRSTQEGRRALGVRLTPPRHVAPSRSWLVPDHGFPVRIIIPGFIGGRMVKWLSEITVTEVRAGRRGGAAEPRAATPPTPARSPLLPAEPSASPSLRAPQTESQNFYHFMDNRVLPSHVDEALAKAEGAWGPGG